MKWFFYERELDMNVAAIFTSCRTHEMAKMHK